MPKGKTGPKTGPNGPRVRLDRGEWLDPETKRHLLLWRDIYGLPIGRAIDDLFKHAIKSQSFRLNLRYARPGLKVGPEALSAHQNACNAKETAISAE